MNALVSFVIRAMVWAGLGWIFAGVYDYAKTTKDSGTQVSLAGAGTAAKESAKSFFSQSMLMRVLVVCIMLALAAIFLLPKLLPKFFKKPKK